MSHAHGQVTEQLALLNEFHTRTHSLALWALDTGKVIKPAPDWREVQDWFAKYGEHRKWVIDNWRVLELFELPRAEAVVWQQMGWRNWHATVIESLVHNGYNMRLGLWLGTPEDKGSEYVVWPDQLDWLREDLGLPDDVPAVERSREAVWQRVQVHTGRAIEGVTPFGSVPGHLWHDCEGWYRLGSFDLWTLVPHLRAELAATKRLLDPHGSFPVRGTANEQPGDGPGPRRSFRWRGKEADFSRAPNRFALCQALWDVKKGEPKMEQRVADVREAVYPNEADAEDKFKDLVQQVRRVFEAQAMALTIEVRSELMWLRPCPE